MTLQIFPKHPATDAYYVNGSYTPWAIVGRDKRFSDAELAAEAHSTTTDALIDHERSSEHMQLGWIFYRFATRPHYDTQ